MSETTCVGHPWLNRSRPADYSKYSPSFPDIPLRVHGFPVSAGLDNPPPSPRNGGPKNTANRVHDATRAKRSPKWIANPVRATCQTSGGARPFRSTPQFQVDQLRHGLAVREVAPRTHRPGHRAAQALDRVGRIDHLPART